MPSLLVALHPDPGARAPGPTTRSCIPGREARQTQGVRTARAVAVVAAALKCAGRLEFPLTFFDPYGM